MLQGSGSWNNGVVLNCPPPEQNMGLAPGSPFSVPLALLWELTEAQGSVSGPRGLRAACLDKPKQTQGTPSGSPIR